jgi:hypothetical protein
LWPPLLCCGVSQPFAAGLRVDERANVAGHAMSRPENPIDRAAGPVAEFASQLRALRVTAGNITYRRMAAYGHYSPTVLSRAADGRLIPTWLVVVAYVRTCGGDPVEWRARWEALRSARPSRPYRCGREA